MYCRVNKVHESQPILEYLHIATKGWAKRTNYEGTLAKHLIVFG